jgi:hypothetical protein
MTLLTIIGYLWMLCALFVIVGSMHDVITKW